MPMEEVDDYMGEIAVLCDICQTKIAKHVCVLCGRRVCSEHFDAKAGLCTICRKGREGARTHRKSQKAMS